MTPDFLGAVGSLSHWAAVGITCVATGLTIGLHFEVLERLNYRLPQWKAIPSRLRILALMLCLMVLHIVEIWIYGFGIHLAIHYPDLGYVSGMETVRLLDAVYLSATTYTTLGYGDLIPHGPIRFLLGVEGLVGLMMITWSASFTYLEMQRYWKTR